MKAPWLSLTAVVAAGLLVACDGSPGLSIVPTDESPGAGERSKKGYAFSEPVLAALEAFHADHGSYPELIADLVPGYLLEKPVAPDGLDYSYSSTGDSFSFSFHYLSPGMNTCTIKPGQEWDCSGAY